MYFSHLIFTETQWRRNEHNFTEKEIKVQGMRQPAPNVQSETIALELASKVHALKHQVKLGALKISWLGFPSFLIGLRLPVGSTTGWAGQGCGGWLWPPTYGSCGTGSKGWSSAMTPRFVAPTMNVLAQMGGEEKTKTKQNSNAMTLAAK